MGGFGIGRYSYSSGPSCEDTHSIDLASLRLRGMLMPGVYSRLGPECSNPRYTDACLNTQLISAKRGWQPWVA
jgi:hypothetical protein